MFVRKSRAPAAAATKKSEFVELPHMSTHKCTRWIFYMMLPFPRYKSSRSRSASKCDRGSEEASAPAMGCERDMS
jgi:hypothetical protein